MCAILKDEILEIKRRIYLGCVIREFVVTVAKCLSSSENSYTSILKKAIFKMHKLSQSFQQTARASSSNCNVC